MSTIGVNIICLTFSLSIFTAQAQQNKFPSAIVKETLTTSLKLTYDSSIYRYQPGLVWNDTLQKLYMDQVPRAVASAYFKMDNNSVGKNIQYVRYLKPDKNSRILSMQEFLYTANKVTTVSLTDFSHPADTRTRLATYTLNRSNMKYVLSTSRTYLQYPGIKMIIDSAMDGNMELKLRKEWAFDDDRLIRYSEYKNSGKSKETIHNYSFDSCLSIRTPTRLDSFVFVPGTKILKKEIGLNYNPSKKEWAGYHVEYYFKNNLKTSRLNYYVKLPNNIPVLRIDPYNYKDSFEYKNDSLVRKISFQYLPDSVFKPLYWIEYHRDAKGRLLKTITIYRHAKDDTSELILRQYSECGKTSEKWYRNFPSRPDFPQYHIYYTYDGSCRLTRSFSPNGKGFQRFSYYYENLKVFIPVQSWQMQITVYPNPGSGLFTFRSDQILQNLNIRIFSLNGKMLLEKNVEQFGELYLLDISNFANGIYIYRIENEFEMHSGKLIKQ